jgi:hypothetical protein
MKAKVYMRLARDGNPWAKTRIKVDASTSPKATPLTGAQGQLHTLHFALELDVPDELLSPAKWPVVEVSLGETPVQVPIEVEAVEP